MNRAQIGIVAKDGGYLVFIEVKYRASGSAGFSLEAIDHRKALRIRNAAVYYPYSHQLPEETPCRFDAAGIDGDEMHSISGMHFKVTGPKCTLGTRKNPLCF